MKIKKINKFWDSILSSDDPSSSKRLVTLIISLHFIIASFVILFIAFYVIFYTTKGKVDAELLGMLKDVLEYDFYIILSGLGFITADGLGKMMLERAKAKVAGNVAVGSPTADVINVDTKTINTNDNSSAAKTNSSVSKFGENSNTEQPLQ